MRRRRAIVAAMSRPAPLPLGLDGAPFAVSEAFALGVRPGALRRSALCSPFWGVRMAADAAGDLRTRCRAALKVLPDGAAFGHVTALRLRGIEVPWRLDRDDRLHVVVRVQGQRPRRSGLVAHVCGRADLASTRVTGLPVTSPAQTWLHLAPVLDVDELVVLGDAMLRRGAAATTVTALERVASAAPGARGAARARRALPLLRPGTDSSLETRTRLVLVHAGLPCPVVNVPVHDDVGRFVALPDLSYPELRIAIEYDGDVHRTDARTWRRDVARTQAMQAAGWRVITLTADDVLHHPDRIISWVTAAILAAHATRA